MKKANLFRLSILMAVMLLFSACGGIQSSSNSGSHGNSQSTASTKVSARSMLGTWDATESVLDLGYFAPNQGMKITFYSDYSCSGTIATSITSENIFYCYPTSWSFLDYEQILEVHGYNEKTYSLFSYKFYVKKNGNTMIFQNVDNSSTIQLKYIKQQ